MRAEYRRPVSVIAAGSIAWLLLCVLRGFSMSMLPSLMVFIAVGISIRDRILPVLLGCATLIILSEPLQTWAVLAAGVACGTAGGSSRVRVAGAAASLSALFALPTAPAIPLAVVSVAGAVIGDRRIRSLLVPVGLVLSVFTTGLPGPPEGHSATASSLIFNGAISYTIPEVNTSRPQVVLAAPFEGTWSVKLAVETGGVRDRQPVAAVRCGDLELLLPEGADSLDLELSPGDTVMIELQRASSPFSHPVVHASAWGEPR